MLYLKDFDFIPCRIASFIVFECAVGAGEYLKADNENLEIMNLLISASEAS